MRLRDFVDIYEGDFTVRYEIDGEFTFAKFNNENYKFLIFRKLDNLEIECITHNKKGNLMVICKGSGCK